MNPYVHHQCEGEIEIDVVSNFSLFERGCGWESSCRLTKTNSDIDSHHTLKMVWIQEHPDTSTSADAALRRFPVKTLDRARNSGSLRETTCSRRYCQPCMQNILKDSLWNWENLLLIVWIDIYVCAHAAKPKNEEKYAVLLLNVMFVKKENDKYRRKKEWNVHRKKGEQLFRIMVSHGWIRVLSTADQQIDVCIDIELIEKRERRWCQVVVDIHCYNE